VDTWVRKQSPVDRIFAVLFAESVQHEVVVSRHENDVLVLRIG